jgi:hypothetical protein
LLHPRVVERLVEHGRHQRLPTPHRQSCAFNVSTRLLACAGTRRGQRREGSISAGIFRVEIRPGQLPVTYSKPVAPPRLTSALTPLKTAPRITAAAAISPQPRSRSVALGDAPSYAVSSQTRVKTLPAMRLARTARRMANGW